MFMNLSFCYENGAVVYEWQSDGCGRICNSILHSKKAYIESQWNDMEEFKWAHFKYECEYVMFDLVNISF